MCCTQPQSALDAGGTPRLNRRRGRSRRSSASNFWFHIGLAVTRSNRRSCPSPSVKAGRCMVSPSAISASMSWMKAFMRAMANVEALISWP